MGDIKKKGGLRLKLEFSLKISKSLKLKEILEDITEAIQTYINAKRVFIFIADKHKCCYEIAHCTNPLDLNKFTIKTDHPLVTCLYNRNGCLLMKDFRETVAYKSMWENEKRQLQDLDIEYALPLKDDNELIGITLLSKEQKKSKLSTKNISILESIVSLGSNAVKNAILYENVYKDACIDELTGVLNRRYFDEVLQQEYEKNKDTSLTLIILNIDDFKLYNQLYGKKEGDYALLRVARIISASVGENGYVARYGDKEFALILPSFDVFAAKNLAEVIRKQILNMNKDDSDYTLKTLTVSGGICSIPYSASDIKQLVENANMAVNTVKNDGKNAIMVYTGREQPIEESNSKSNNTYENKYAEYASAIDALTAAINTKERFSFNHSRNVAYYATELAYAYGLNDECVEIVREAALLHDIGKINIPEQILNKPGKLTNEEYQIVKSHVENSIGIIRHFPSLDHVIPAVIGHHERYDGNGYPRRIAKEDIPVSARILCIADSFDAMISSRPYKKAYSIGDTLRILKEQAGLQFDPILVRIFIRLIESNSIKVCIEEPA